MGLLRHELRKKPEGRATAKARKLAEKGKVVFRKLVVEIRVAHEVIREIEERLEETLLPQNTEPNLAFG
ncbi:MAG: hypothetical protein V4449_01785 [Patescibacteria group bacterium]